MFFVLGGVLELVVNKGFRCRPSKLAWWVSWLNSVGSVLFLVGSVAGWLMAPDTQPTSALSMTAIFSYVVGSALFLIGSVLVLYMWKLEQYGHSILPSLNNMDKSQRRGTVTVQQLFFLVVYSCVVALRVSAISFTKSCDPGRTRDEIIPLLLPIGMIVLASALHRVPEQAPFSYLFWMLRLLLLYDLIVVILDVAAMGCTP